MKHILSIIVNNKPGVMSHVSGLFTRRSFNIDSVAVGVTDKPEYSTMTIVLNGDDRSLLQFESQLLKLPDVIEAKKLTYHDSVVKELILARVKAEASKRSELLGIVEVFGGRINEITEDSMLIELSGDQRQVNGLIKMLEPFGILEIARTGQIALALKGEG
ncbi:MAG: acetolactate synthase small subunit [Spirochaetia bacterium]|nr:acetolactate synthase small subunit [Spirochaetia bacterium]